VEHRGEGVFRPGWADPLLLYLGLCIHEVLLYKEATGHGKQVFPTKFKLVEGGNHFIHYNLPDLLLQEVVQGCTES